VKWYCSSSGEILHFKWRDTALQVERYCTSIGEILHFKWRGTALQVGHINFILEFI
jgi:hypothetical protein